MNAHDLIKEAIAEKGKFDSVYWIACGGSMIDLIPAHELLQREATTFTSYIYTAREFCVRVVWARSPWSSPAATVAIPRRSSRAARLPLPPALR